MYESLISRISTRIKYDIDEKFLASIVSWKEDYGFSDRIIIEAVDRAVMLKGADISYKYIGAILKKWKEKNVTKYSDILALDEEHKKSKTPKSTTIKKSSTKKNFVLDTNILIHNPYAITKFEDNNIYISHAIIEELDNFKTERNERGYYSREALRQLKKFRDKGDLKSGVTVNEKGGKIYSFVQEKLDYSKLPEGWKKDKMDNIILLSILELSEKLENVILVTNDCNMLFKADCLGIKVEEYKNDRLQSNDEVYRGFGTYYIDDENFELLTRGESIKPNYIYDTEGYDAELTNNEYLVIKNNSDSSYLAKYSNNNISKLLFANYNPLNLIPRNLSQKFLTNSLMQSVEDVALTIVNGPAGTGKTLFAIACGLEQVMERKIYQRILITRANVLMDEDIGYLPGTEEEKISPLFRGIYDNIDFLFRDKDDTPEMTKDKRTELFQRGYIVMESLSYLRGRSIDNTYVIIDEAQNCTPEQIFTIITRAGVNSKFVLLGDFRQVDNVRLDSRNNGLIYAINKMKGSPHTDIITFDEKDCVRSALAKEASERLKR